MTRLVPVLSIAALAASLVVCLPVRAEKPKPAPPVSPLNAEITALAPAILNHLKKQGFTNVGVLKFEVQRGTDVARDDVGELNSALAHKVEVAIALTRNKKDTFQIIPDPSRFVIENKMVRANHKTPEGRKAFFDENYIAEYGSNRIPASAFLTGSAVISADHQRIKIQFQAFDATGAMQSLPMSIDVATDPETLALAGKSYASAALPTANTQADVIDSIRRNDAAEKDPARPRLPALDDSPIEWKVLYGDKEIAPEGSTVREPKECESIGFTLTNRGKGTYAVVLLVNGANTLGEEGANPLDCQKWVLVPGASVSIRGFQTGPKDVKEFKVLVSDEARQKFNEDRFRYGNAAAGTFRMVVFAGEMKDMPGPGDPTATIKDDVRVVRGVRNNPRAGQTSQPQTLKDAQDFLRDGNRFTEYGRGYVSKGAVGLQNPTKQVNFILASDTPVADITLRYFTPER